MALPTTRRTLLIGGAATAALVGVSRWAPSARAATVYEQVLARRREFLTGGQVAATEPSLADKRAGIDAAAKVLVDSCVQTSGRTGLWADLPVGNATTTAQVGNMGVTGTRLVQLATVHASPGSTYYASPSLLAKIHDGLTFLSGFYKTGHSRPGNWWFWEIGIPRNLADVLVLLGDALPPAQTVDSLLSAVRYFAPDPNVRTGSTLKEAGANRVDKALACIVRGLLSQNEADIVLGRDALSDVKGNGANSLFATVSSGDGFYTDGSFVQHAKLPYSGTYGAVALSGVGAVLQMLAGSTWAVTDPKLSNLFGAIEKTFAPFQWDIRTMDTTRGRAVSRQNSRDYDSGFDIASAIIVVAASAPDEDQRRYRSLVKGWLERTTDQSVANNSQALAISARSLALLQDASVQAAEPRIGTTHTFNQERMVHHRDTWAATVSTASARIGRFEWGNAENQTGWYQGDGVFYLYHRSDPGQFSDDFWPTVDPYALPGITVNGEDRAASSASGTGIPAASNDFAGGLTLGGVVGTTAMDLTNATGKLTANKSWFFLQDHVLCLGTKITDTSGTPVNTIVENRSFPVGKLPQVQVDKEVTALGTTAVQGTAAHIEGHAGFVSLPVGDNQARPLAVRTQDRTGTWYDINAGSDTAGSKDPVSRSFVRIEQAHSGTNDWYAYLVLPQATAEQTADAAEKPPVEVLVADPLAHVISDGQVTMGNFFAKGTFGGYTVDKPCSIGHQTRHVASTQTPTPTPTPTQTSTPTQTVAETRQFAPRIAAGTVQTDVFVSQPTKAGGTVNVSFPFDAPGDLLSSSSAVTVTSTSPLAFSVDMTGARGSQLGATFGNRPTPEPVTVHHVDDTGASLAADVKITGQIGDPYQALPLDPPPVDHDPAQVPANASGTIADTPISVTFVYPRKQAPTPTQTPTPSETPTASPTASSSPSAPTNAPSASAPSQSASSSTTSSTPSSSAPQWPQPSRPSNPPGLPNTGR